MLFNSVVFITTFLPLCLIGWYLLKRLRNPAYAKGFLILMSFWFYGYYNPWYLLILFISLIINYMCSMAFEKLEAFTYRKLVLAVGLLGNLGILFYFKYFNFFIDNCRFIFHTDWNIEKIALPLGISFFTLQQISYIIDRYKKEAPHYKVIDYTCFVTFFPQLIAGPIVLHNEFIPQLMEMKEHHFSTEEFFDGLSLFILGLAKKVLLADVFAKTANLVFDDIAIIPYYLDAPSAWVTILCFMFQLYFDFSGYCDMARGLAGMFGLHLPQNFNAPYKATSVKDLWRRWHMTLTRFLTSYVYYPLGGSKKGNVRKNINIIIVFLVSGIWHGANWTYIVWGLLQGLANAFENIFPKVKFKHDFFNCIKTDFVFLLGLVFFRSDSVSTALIYLRKMFTGGYNGYLMTIGRKFEIPEVYAIENLIKMNLPVLLPYFGLICVFILIVLSIFLLKGKLAEEWIQKKAATWKGVFILGTLFTWVLISLSQVSTFLYFNF